MSAEVIHGDCLEVLKTLGEHVFDAVITDPPYGTEGAGDGYGRRQLASPDGRSGHKILGDADLSVLTEAMPLLRKSAKQDSWVAMFCSPKRRHEVDRILDANQAVPVGETIWDKGAPGLGYTVRYAHEPCLIRCFGKPKRNSGALLSVIRTNLPSRAIGERHPHEKPEGMLVDLVKFCCPEGGTVLDPFCGSGTTGVACLRTGRNFVGIEMSDGWAGFAKDRLEAAGRGLTRQQLHAGQTTIFDLLKEPA